MYSVSITTVAEKQFKKLDKGTQRRISAALERIKIRPYDFVQRLVGEPYFKFRVGDYRLILDIQNDRMVILVMEIGHRKNVYNNYG